MYVSIDNASQFHKHFYAMVRMHPFSYEALDLLYEFLEENTEGYELDVIALCCEYSEDTERGIAEAYGLHEDEDVTAYLEQHTHVVGVTDSGTILYAQF
jgi:hypothetical protein